MKTKYSHRMNIGGTSIILILVVFALTIFAVLSIRTSYHELKMTEKTRDAVEAYYIADSKTEVLIAKISAIFDEVKKDNRIDKQKLEQKLLKINEVTKINLQNGIINLEVPVNDASSLQLELQFDSKSNNPGFTTQSWKLVPVVQTSFDEDTIEVWDGSINE